MNILEFCLKASRGTLTEQDIQLYKNEHNIRATEPHLQRTPLHYAAYFGQEKIVKLLIDSGMDINAQDKEGNTPLHLAALKKHYDVIDMLVEQNADPLKENLKSQTPLMVHCTHNHQVADNDRHNAVADMLKQEMLRLKVQENSQLVQYFPAINSRP